MSEPRATPSVEALEHTAWEDVATSDADFDEMEAGLRELATQAAASGDREAESSCALLSAICSLQPTNEKTHDPYVPMWQFAGRRSFLPDDLREEDLAFLQDLLSKTKSPWLAARIGDLLWLKKYGPKPYQSAQIAVSNWLDAGMQVKHWMDALENWPRFLQLARQLKLNDHLQRAYNTLRALFWNPDTERRRKLDLAELMLLTGQADKGEVERIAAELTKDASIEKDSLIGRQLYEYVAYLQRRLDNEDDYSTAQYAVVQWWMNEADRRSADSAAASVSLYQSALKELRLIPNSQRARLNIENLATTLAEKIRAAGVGALDEMTAFTSPGVDLSDDAERVQAAMSGHDAANATALFVSLVPYLSEAEERKAAEDRLADSVMLGLFTAQTFADDGRVIGTSGPNMDGPWAGYPANVWEEMQRTFGDIHIQWAAKIRILSALDVLTLEHRIRLRDLLAVSRSSPFVPADRHESVARALAAGFNQDWIAALYLTTPQVENIVRSVLNEAGVKTTQMKEDNSEHELGLSSLLERTELNDILTPDILFELRLLFGGPTGPNLRNNAAHGLLSDAAAKSLYAVYAWYFLLRLVYIPYWNGLHSEDDGSGESARDVPPTS